ncbi:CCA tRNA nucleotidyltransferase [Candidatus Dependentiae bacterium]|nr:CCA tRNA nucleotidyltransferase [Candidatus Dependentiae bacterium]
MKPIQDRIQICIVKIIQNNRQLKNIFEEIYQQGGRVLLVGGAVRDCLLGCISSDLDFEVYHISFVQLQDILEKFGVVSFIGKSFGVLRIHGIDADWSIPRTDSYGRRPEVELNPNMSFTQAFRRRDITINAMGIDVHSLELIDPFNGLQDLENKIIRSPDLSFFVQDPLRLFRVMQFVARFQMNVDPTLSKVCQTMDVSQISAERIWQEFSKLFLKSQYPSIGVRWLETIGRLSEIFPGVTFDQSLYDSLDCLAQQDVLPDEQKLVGLWSFIVQKNINLMITSVSVYDKISLAQYKMLSDFLKRYMGSQDLIEKIILVSWYLPYITLAVHEEKDIVYQKIASFLDNTITLQQISDIAVCWYNQEIVEKFIHQARSAKVLYYPIPELLNGKDLLTYAQGKDLGDLLKFAYNLQLEKSISDKQQLLDLVLKQKQ